MVIVVVVVEAEVVVIVVVVVVIVVSSSWGTTITTTIGVGYYEQTVENVEIVSFYLKPFIIDAFKTKRVNKTSNKNQNNTVMQHELRNCK